MITYKVETQKCQILHAHKPCFLMPGHIYDHTTSCDTTTVATDAYYLWVVT